MDVSIAPLTACPEHAALLREASQDSELVNNTYLPANLTVDQALAWCAAHPVDAFVVYVGSEPVGLAMISEGVAGVSQSLVPEQAWETETWLLGPWRGKRIAVAAWEQIEDLLRAAAPHVRHLVAIVWEENAPSHRQLARNGFWDSGACWWAHESDPDDAGWCRMWVRCLHPDPHPR